MSSSSGEPDKTLDLPAAAHRYSAHFATRTGEAGHPRTLAIFLGGDLAAGRHEVRVNNLRGEEGPLWARFFVSRRRSNGGENAVQFELTEDLLSATTTGVDE